MLSATLAAASPHPFFYSRGLIATFDGDTNRRRSARLCELCEYFMPAKESPP